MGVPGSDRGWSKSGPLHFAGLVGSAMLGVLIVVLFVHPAGRALGELPGLVVVGGAALAVTITGVGLLNLWSRSR